MFEELENCRRRIVEEERLAREAPSREVAIGYEQMAQLYRVRLAVLMGGAKRATEVSSSSWQPTFS